MLRSTRIIIILISLLSISLPGQGNRLNSDTLEDSLSLAASPDDSLSLLLKLTEKYRYSAPQKSIEFGKLSIEIAYRINDHLSRTIAYTLLGQTYYEIGVYDKALENYSNALNRCIEKYNKLFVANCFTNIGKVYRELEVYQLAISKFEDAHKLFMEEEKHKGQAQSLFNLGVTYAKMDDFDQSMQYFNDVLDFDDKLLNDQLRASTYKNIGNVFLERGNIKMAADFYDRAMNIFVRLHDNKNIASMNVRYSDLLMSHHDHQGALDKLIEAEKIFDKLNNRKRLAKTYLAIAKVSMISGDHDRTTTSINQAIAIAHEYTIKTVLKDAYFLLYTFYSGNGEIETALEYFLMYNDLHEAVLTKELINTIALTETRNTFVQHQINIDSIDSEKQVQKYTRWFALILISLTVLIVFLSFSRLISQRKANVVLARQRNILKETLAELKINEEKYKALFSQANDAIFLMDKETFVDCNDETLKMFACKREEIIGLPPYTFSPEKQPDGQASRDKALALIKKCYRGEPQRFYWAHSKLDGTIFDAEVSLNLITLEDGNYIQAIVRDISDRVLAEKEMVEAREKAEKATSSKTFFLAKMSHEIRTMLGGITSASQLLNDTKLDKHQAELVNIINTSADNLLSIANEILDMSKIEAGKVEIESRGFTFKSSIENTVNMYLPKAREKNVSLYLSIHPRTPSFVSGDELRLRQILNNLLSNAIKFTDEGSVTVEVEVVKEYSKSYLVGLKVSDTGIGIPENKARDMFAEYSQSDASISRRYGGTGLGLNIVYKLVKLLGGTIEVSSELNKGTQFIINLPFTKAEEDIQELKKEKSPLKDHKKYSILLAEDNLLNQKITLINLENLGHEVELANNGNEAWEKYQMKKYDIILMDIQMPEKDGIEVTRLIRAHEKNNPEAGYTRIIALTANIFGQDAEYCLAEGMDAFIGKPFRIEDIIEKMDANGDKS